MSEKGSKASPVQTVEGAGVVATPAPLPFMHPLFVRVELLEDVVLPSPLGFCRAGGVATLRREFAASLVADGMGSPIGSWTVDPGDLLAGIGRLLGTRTPAEFDTKATEVERRRMRRLIDGMGER